MDIKQTCFDLAMAVGLPGDETAAAEKAKSMLEKYMPAETDALGNVVGTLEGDGVHILLDAHIDQVGLIVRGIDDDGFILFDRCGGADVRTLVGNEVTVWGEKELFGVICSVPPHLSGAKKENEIDIKKLAIDVGLTKEEVQKLVCLGDRITYRMKPTSLLGTKIACRGFDDRCGIAAILLCLEKLRERKHNCKLTVLFSSREEVGGSGAAVGSFAAAPDEAIAVDVGFGVQEGVALDSETIELGKGPSIGVSSTLDLTMQKNLVSLAEKHGIPYQHDVMSGRTGTNCDSITVSGKGIPCALLSVPLRSMHTPVEVIDTKDIEATAQLMCEYICERGGANA